MLDFGGHNDVDRFEGSRAWAAPVSTSTFALDVVGERPVAALRAFLPHESKGDERTAPQGGCEDNSDPGRCSSCQVATAAADERATAAAVPAIRAR